jgi:DNA invertase Pin-like site-specific DNA recombinase
MEDMEEIEYRQYGLGLEKPVMREQAGKWFRVSTGGQDEQSQRPDLMRWCDSHDYDTPEDCEYTVHGGSAFKGNKLFDETWAQVLEDMRTRKITVLVVWKQNRLDRKLETFQMLAQVMEAGGRVEFVTQPQLNNLTTMAGRLSLKIEEELAHADSENKSDAVKAKLIGLRSAGSVVGRAPWGYRIGCRECGEKVPKRETCHSGVKVLYLTPDGRRYILAIFQMVIDGYSLRDIAEYLTAEGVKTTTGKPWNEAYLGNKLIRNPTYYGKRRNSGELAFEALVSVSTWQQAQAALASRVRTGRSTTVHDKVLVSPVCGNPDCDATGTDHDSPMYRMSGGKPANRRAYFHCKGRGPQRRGCGAPVIPVEELEAAVCEAMQGDDSWHVERVFIAGDDIADRMAEQRERGAAAMRAGDFDAVQDAMAAVRELETAIHVDPHWAERETDKTVGQHFSGLDRDGQRAYLASYYLVRAYQPVKGEPPMLSMVHRTLQ